MWSVEHAPQLKSVCLHEARGGWVKRVPFEERERGWRGEGDAGKQRKVEHQRKSHEVSRAIAIHSETHVARAGEGQATACGHNTSFKA
jgi:hypothetical protein